MVKKYSRLYQNSYKYLKIMDYKKENEELLRLLNQVIVIGCKIGNRITPEFRQLMNEIDERIKLRDGYYGDDIKLKIGKLISDNI